MVIVIARAQVKAGAEARFVEAAQACVAQTVKESGNLSYRLLLDTARAGDYSFVEQWASRADLDLHMKTPHFLALGPAIDGLLEGDMAVEVFEA